MMSPIKGRAFHALVDDVDHAADVFLHQEWHQYHNSTFRPVEHAVWREYGWHIHRELDFALHGDSDGRRR
jgi:hypothetical protein